MGKILTFIFLCITASATLLTGCNSGGCTELRSVVPRADLYGSDDKPVTIDSLSVTGVGVPGDSVLYGPSERISSLYLPMPAGDNTVRWRIAYMQRAFAQYDLADTITIDFDRTPFFAGIDCGAMYKYKITNLRTTHFLIDSVRVLDSLVINVDAPAFNIYFRTE